MALQIWLPLNGNLNNQGLATNTFSNEGSSYITVDNSGKIGKCYNFNSTANNLGIYSADGGFMDKYINNKSWTICAWVQTSSSDTIVVSLSYGLRMFVGASTYISLYNSSRSVNCTSSVNANDGKWHHLAATYNVSTNTIKFYVDGVNTGTQAYTSGYTYASSWVNGLYVGKDPNNSTVNDHYLFKGKMNDVRVYDHALSPREVAEIAKGLVLHYPLDRDGFGRDNNIKSSVVTNRGCNNFIYNSQTNIWTMSAPVNSSAWGVGIYINDTSIKWKSGESWVISMDVYVPKTMTWNHDINNKPDVSDTSSYTGNDYDDQRLYCSNGIMSSHSLQVGWNKIWFTQRAPSTYGLFNYTTNWGVVTSSESVAIDIQIKNIKGEIIPVGAEVKPTPWLPNPADAAYTALGFNDGIEYDVSGYNHNGTKHGTLTYDADTPRYNTSTKFTDNSYIKHKLPEQMYYATYSFWVKASSYANYGAIYITFGSPSSGYSPWLSVNTESCKVWAYFGGNSPYYTKGAGGSVTTNEWHHCVYVWDNGVAQWYLDGEKCGNAVTYTGKTYIQNTDDTTIGNSYTGTSWNGTKFNGQISDFRIYATALTADQVKELYSTAASLSDNGTLFANEFIEM